jgi:hypothetical protein
MVIKNHFSGFFLFNELIYEIVCRPTSLSYCLAFNDGEAN